VTSDQSDVNNDTSNINKADSSNGKTSDSPTKKSTDSNQSRETTENPSTNSTIISDSEMDDLKKVAEELAKIGEELWEEFSSDEQQSEGELNVNQCAKVINEDYSEVRQKLNHQFYFPPCSH